MMFVVVWYLALLLLMTSAISCPLWSSISVRVPESGVCVHISGELSVLWKDLKIGVTPFLCFRGELGFLNCDNICMCVVNKQFEVLEFIFDSVYVALQYDKISLTFTAGSVSLCCDCGHVVVFGLLLLLYALFNHPRR